MKVKHFVCKSSLFQKSLNHWCAYIDIMYMYVHIPYESENSFKKNCFHVLCAKVVFVVSLCLLHSYCLKLKELRNGDFSPSPVVHLVMPPISWANSGLEMYRRPSVQKRNSSGNTLKQWINNNSSIVEKTWTIRKILTLQVWHRIGEIKNNIFEFQEKLALEQNIKNLKAFALFSVA